MNQYMTYIALGFGVLFLSLLVPGLKVIAEAILKGLMSFLGEILKHKGTFMVWLVKTIIADHARVFQHATRTKDDLDPTQKVRRAAEGRGDD